MKNEEWVNTDQVSFFERNGYVVIKDLLTPEEVTVYREIYDDFLSGKIEVGRNRSDLGESIGNNEKVENITQIMWPSNFVERLEIMPLHTKALKIAKKLMGPDIEMDFDMLISKAPYTNTITPWHQDAAYWIELPDKRAASCWLSLDVATIDNGCMWFVPGSNLLPIRPHTYAGKEGGALVCEASEIEGVAVPLSPGSCTFHSGGTLHYSRGNDTNTNRRAFIINYRPRKMIDLERLKGFDHGKNGTDRSLKNDSAML